MHRIDTAGNVAGLFADPDPIHGQIAVVCDSAWLNDVQENIMAVLAAAGIAGVKGTTTQLRDAIKSLILASFTHVVDSGAANAYVIAPTPALGAYAEGVAYSVRFVHANTAASTINVSALGVKNLVHPDGTALIAGDIPAGAEGMIIYDATGGVFQLLEGVDGQATTTVQGLVKLATNTLAKAGVDTTTAVTPAALEACFNPTLGANGFVTLPGGDMIQRANNSSANTNEGTVVVTLPTNFPNACDGAWLTTRNTSASASGTTVMQYDTSATNSVTVFVQDASASGWTDDPGGIGVLAWGH